MPHLKFVRFAIYLETRIRYYILQTSIFYCNKTRRVLVLAKHEIFHTKHYRKQSGGEPYNVE